ncbi:aminotransferase class I/II-fold pyridoxal phosphate-dependent enzyme [Pseudomonas sp. BCA14]|uniref:pyoverdine biosynthesis transaminase PtaA n=1 Tax=unclassified Pseudomonas TaxID=196821 RepID=UPI00106E67BE|nr:MULTISPECIES: pyridoxal phosphate-dependent aminotransferase [unclassified Pseudomonas]TFF05826.1 aminotransferase class I/II-fold pyridoxal phosphate-dependent enzyme [Pseudomonas sp. JMN1]TFF08079.1 aminotransferase class I/II-fold pyridoxal phosphate-dependent enzyme [Pseudomonas sp. BCA17]TFF24006.1 aminotransferase class I/II-fold pyridoxal phosphate-dependent enzyme [Pseudomonas sp. BCA14]TFF28257.1 aminotransferase class I/II-fold pyridoxal phosphate-dependent enzyme [Pseudomonas sp. 
MVSVSRRSLLALGAALPVLGHLDWALAGPPPKKSDKVLLNYNESPYGPSSAAREAMQRGIATSGRYPYPDMYALAALFAQQQGINEENVAVFAGSMAALRYAVLAFTSPTRGLVMATPSYEVPRQAAESHKAPVHEVNLDAQHAHDVPAMLAANPQAGMLYLCNPNNPTGTLTPTEAIRQALANKPRGSVLVVDEAYIDFSDAPSCVSWVKEHDDLLVLRTFSKIYGMAGARLGLAVGHPALLERLAVFGGDNVPAASSLLGARASLEDVALLPQRKALNARLREETIAWLKTHGFTCTVSHSNCFMIDVKQPAAHAIERLAAQNVMVGRVWKNWPQWVRVTVGTQREMERFREVFAAQVMKA